MRWLTVPLVACLILCTGVAASGAPGTTRVALRVERPAEGAPLTFGLPFPKDALDSPDHVRVLTPDGREIPSQTTEVTSWEPASGSVKWLWVFFFATRSDAYVLEFGPAVRRAAYTGDRVVVFNNQRERGGSEITTGPLRLTIRQGEGGFIARAELDQKRDGFSAGDLIAESNDARGSFVDVLDEAGIDRSKAVIIRTSIEKGSGPLHAILRVDGEYRYGRADNNPSPFTLRIHAYAGKSYVRVLHTFVYTGVPDKHRPQEGEYPHVATQAENLIVADRSDDGWKIPRDRLASIGLALDLKLSGTRRILTGLNDGRWWEDGRTRMAGQQIAAGDISLLQTGPDPSRTVPVPESSPASRLGGFIARLADGGRTVDQTERAEGWMDVADDTRGVAVGLLNFVEEYPKEIRAANDNRLTAFLWSPQAEPMSFARVSNDPGQEGAIENWAQGTAKTSELCLFFHAAGGPPEQLATTMRSLLHPPVAHASPSWYGASGVYGQFAARSTAFPDLERGIDYKFDWWLFNQRWMPWFGMFDYGDGKLYFDNEKWDVWSQNEPAEDFELWVQFMRTGDARIYTAAQAFARHSMDVDNIHWPASPVYVGDSNYPLDYWKLAKEPRGSNYIGIGRRHAPQHWQHVLSAHVWVQGWLADYYLAADHRGLDIAIQTADMHLRRIWGEHGLTGRRLYLAAWNLTQVWDATKDARYQRELQDLVERMLRVQEREQGGSLVMDRFGYANVYVTHGLSEYLSMTGDARVRAALIRHARVMRDLEPLNHQMESYLSSLHSLSIGYDLTGDASFLAQMRRRMEVMNTDPIARPIDDTWTQHDLAQALEKASRLPADPNRRNGRGLWTITNGLRVFGWTHGFTLPWCLSTLERAAPAGSR